MPGWPGWPGMPGWTGMPGKPGMPGWPGRPDGSCENCGNCGTQPGWNCPRHPAGPCGDGWAQGWDQAPPACGGAPHPTAWQGTGTAAFFGLLSLGGQLSCRRTCHPPGPCSSGCDARRPRGGCQAAAGAGISGVAGPDVQREDCWGSERDDCNCAAALEAQAEGCEACLGSGREGHRRPKPSGSGVPRFTHWDWRSA